LLLGQLGHRWQHAKRVAAQHDDVLGVPSDARNVGVVNELDRIARAGVPVERAKREARVRASGRERTAVEVEVEVEDEVETCSVMVLAS